VVNEIVNRELPEKLQIAYRHFDMKKRKKDADFPKNLHEVVKPFIKKMGMFICKRQRMNDEVN